MSGKQILLKVIVELKDIEGQSYWLNNSHFEKAEIARGHCGTEKYRKVKVTRK